MNIRFKHGGCIRFVDLTFVNTRIVAQGQAGGPQSLNIVMLGL